MRKIKPWESWLMQAGFIINVPSNQFVVKKFANRHIAHSSYFYLISL